MQDEIEKTRKCFVISKVCCIFAPIKIQINSLIKRKIMKKYLMIACMMLMSTAMFAQDSKFAIGINAGMFAHGDEYNPFGLGAKFQYEFVQNVRAELSGDYWFKKDGYGLWDANLDIQYLIPIAEGLKVYPMAGATLMGNHGDGEKKTAFGFNAGAGIEYYVAESVKLNLDIKYLYAKKDGVKNDGPVFQIGVAYAF